MRLKKTKNADRIGFIELDSEMGKELGLTSDRFDEFSYLWLKDNTLYLSSLISKQEHQGYVLNILNKAKEKGYDMEACVVSARMRNILAKFGFKPTVGSLWAYKNEK